MTPFLIGVSNYHGQHQWTQLKPKRTTVSFSESIEEELEVDREWNRSPKVRSDLKQQYKNTAQITNIKIFSFSKHFDVLKMINLHDDIFLFLLISFVFFRLIVFSPQPDGKY